MKDKKKILILGITLVMLVAAVLVPILIFNKKDEPVQTVTETTTETSFEKPNEPVLLTGLATPSGSCGENADWCYHTEEKELEITGSGTIDDASGWKSFADEVESVKIKSGISDFEIDVFNSLTNADDYYFSESVNKETCERFFKSDYYMNRAGRENGVLYRDGVLVDVDPYVSGVFEVKEGTTAIGPSAFSRTAVTKIVVPDSVTHIGLCAFICCEKLEELVIGSGLKDTLAEYLFVMEGTEINPEMGAYSLKRIIVSPSNQNFCSEDGVLYNKDKTKLLWYPASRDSSEFMIPDSVTEIADFAFTNLITLKKLFIGKNVKSLEKFSMLYCSYDDEYNFETLKLRVNFDIYYEGTKEEWEKISSETFMEGFFDYPTVYYNSKPFDEKSTDFMTAYNRYLKNYNGGKYGEHFRFELVYFNNDDIPELFVSEENAHVGSVKIFTYTNGKVVQIYEGGRYGTLNYIERNSIVVETDLHQGIVYGCVKRIGDDGTEEVLFSHTDNSGAVPEGSDEVYYKIGDENVSKFVYEMEVFRRMPEDTSEFCDGIPMSNENIDKYCK